MAKLQIPNFHPLATINAAQLAEWLDEHRDEWWRIDSEPRLTERIDFPCPGDELAEVMRSLGDRTLEILSDQESRDRVQQVTAKTFESYADRNNRYKGRNFLLRWRGEKPMWLLSEDVPATESSKSEA